MSSTRVKDLFDGVNDETDLSKFIQDKTKEGLYLEFKTKEDSRVGTLGDGDKKHFSKALSGFANSDGGILIWGIKTNLQEEASDLRPISEVDTFFAALKKSIINSTQPVVDNIEMQIVTAKTQAGAGYVKCYIPPSDKVPHRAMLADREYFKRSTEGFYRLEHFDLEDMFGRRPRPYLVLVLDTHNLDGEPGRHEIHFTFLNSGRGVARFAGFLCKFSPEVRITAVTGEVGNVSNLNQDKPTVTHGNDTGVIHPNGIRISAGHVRIDGVTNANALPLEVSWYCENMLTRKFVGLVPTNTSGIVLGTAV